MRVVVLAGGTGGGKLAAGMHELLPDGLSVIANTADDTDVHGLRVSPDPDLITYWLAGEIDEERGWGIRDDAFVVHARLVKLGAPGWFQLSDRDLATCLYRTRFLAEGGSLAGAQGQIARALGVRAAVLPMCEADVRTRVRTAAGWRGLQEFLILDHGAGPVEAVEVEGLDDAEPAPEARAALAAAEAIVIGPSNPVISIEPILAVPGMRDAIGESGAPVVAVSPYVDGRVLKGPTSELMRAGGRDPNTNGVAAAYEGLASAMVVDSGDPDQPPDGLEILTTSTLMDSPDSRREVAGRVLEFAGSLD